MMNTKTHEDTLAPCVQTKIFEFIEHQPTGEILFVGDERAVSKRYARLNVNQTGKLTTKFTTCEVRAGDECRKHPGGDQIFRDGKFLALRGATSKEEMFAAVNSHRGLWEVSAHKNRHGGWNFSAHMTNAEKNDFLSKLAVGETVELVREA